MQQPLSASDRRPTQSCRPPHPAGFTVIELVITLLVFALLMVAMLVLFDMSNKMARAQTHVADMQQSLRIATHEMVHATRIAARGPGWNAPADFAIERRNNADDATYITGVVDPQLKVLPGTDVLIVRGVLAGSLFRVQPVVTGASADQVSFELSNLSPEGVTQSLEPLAQAKADDMEVTLILISTLGEFALGVFDPEQSEGAAGSMEIFVGFGTDAEPAVPDDTAIRAGLPGANRPSWTTDSPPRPVAMFGVLEEVRFYVRENPPADPSDPLAQAQPRLAMARVFPGTENAWGGNAANLRLDIADNIIDFQVAFGVDENEDGIIEDLGDETDEWFGNHAGDGVAPWIDVVRLSILARTNRPEASYVSPAIARIEDRDYDEGHDPATDHERWERMHHRRLLQTVVNLRNL